MEELKKIIEALNNAIGILNEIINEPSPEDGEPKEDINEPSPEDMDKTIDDEDVVNKQEEDIEIFTAEIQKTILDNIKNKKNN